MGIKITPDLAIELDRIIHESVKSVLTKKALQEKEKQDSFTSTTSQTTSKAKEDDQSRESYDDPKVDDIVEKLNSIRSGKSFKDELVSNAMEKYISDLSKAERVALLAFLKGIAQIVTGEISGEKAFEPSDPPASVSMEKDVTRQTKNVKPNVIKTSIVSDLNKKKDVEDTSAPVPITPKKK